MSNMMATLLACALCIYACSVVQCSRNPEAPGATTNRPPHPPDSAAGSRSDELQAEYNGILAMLKEESINSGIPNLRDVTAGPQTETRMWVGFGLAVPKCFILSNRSDENAAFYVGPKVVGNRAVLDAEGKVLITKTTLPAPKSGWDDFERFLKSRGVDKTLRLAPVKEPTADVDVRYIVIEVKSGDSYSMVFYSLSEESGDRPKALEVCQRVEQEFGILMGCGGARS